MRGRPALPEKVPLFPLQCSHKYRNPNTMLATPICQAVVLKALMSRRPAVLYKVPTLSPRRLMIMHANLAHSAAEARYFACLQQGMFLHVHSH